MGLTETYLSFGLQRKRKKIKNRSTLSTSSVFLFNFSEFRAAMDCRSSIFEIASFTTLMRTLGEEIGYLIP
ncbi:hypothetical protein V6Z12_D03G134800 [Gossypium hirsutum]